MMGSVRRRVRLLLACVVPWAVAGAAIADDYPSRPVSLVVPYPPGGPNDLIARALQPELAQILGQNFVIENRGGAGGNIATGQVARAAPDGYTVVLPGIPYAINPTIYSKVPYALADFQAVSMIARGPLVLVAHPSLGVKSVEELVAAARAKPGTIGYGSGGVGTSPHLAGALFESSAKVELLHVPYKGTGEVVPDLIAGRIPVAFLSSLVVRSHVEAGRLVALGTTASAPMKGWESLPPIARAVPGYEVYAWYSLMVPAKTPPEVTDKLNQATLQALKAPKMLERLSAMGLDPTPSSPAEADAYVRAEAARWAKVARDANIKVD